MYYSNGFDRTGMSGLAYLGQTEDCEAHAKKVEIFTRLSQKKDKSAATRASAASQAAAYQADYQNCLARQAGGLPGTMSTVTAPAIPVASLGPPAVVGQVLRPAGAPGAPGAAPRRAAQPLWKNKYVIIGGLIVAGVAAYFWYQRRKGTK
jgi:hypothetical protein